MNRVTLALGRFLARLIEKQTKGYVLLAVVSPTRLRQCLRPGDVLLVEGDRRISTAIKYLTQSTWSHAAMFVGDPGNCDLIEADLRAGVRYVALDEYTHLNLRICRPVKLTDDDLAKVTGFMRASIGKTYDLKNVFDLARYLLPQPPVPKRFRRRLLAMGSGDPTRAICSTLIAEAFESIRYPILPMIQTEVANNVAREIWHIRHHSLYAPRDFDVSPYFAIIKPTIEAGFDYRGLHWNEGGSAPAPQDHLAASNSGTSSSRYSVSAAASNLRPDE
jgi:Permuted papain-like amidase enzyme, YaeF/YiiX, C92 family